MRTLSRVLLASCVVLFGAGVATARAQDAGWTNLSVSVARIDYDLSRVGAAPGIAVRTTRAFTPGLALELGGMYAKLDQQFESSTLFMPEAQLQYHWRLGRFSPYVGGGIGAAMHKWLFFTDWDPTLSAAVGTGVRLTDRLGLTGELRLRGHQFDFAGSTADLSVGLAWRLPAF